MCRTSTFLTMACVVIAACGGDSTQTTSDAEPDARPKPDTVVTACDVGELRCEAGMVVTCGEDGAWGEPALCPQDQTCREGSCGEPTAEQLEQAQNLEGLVQFFLDYVGWVEDLGINGDALKAKVRATLFAGDGSAHAFYRAAWEGTRAFRVGHLGMFSSSSCGVDLAWQEASSLGACARPHGDHFIVTAAFADNPLGLSPGDRVVAINGLEGDAMVEYVAAQPVCGMSAASDSALRTIAAVSLFGVLRRGAHVTIVAPDGSERTATVETFSSTLVGCRDPLWRDRQVVIEATLRDDGVGVVRLSGLAPVGGFTATTNEEVKRQIEAFKQELATEFAKVAGARGIVWDLRGNSGGASPAAFSIVGGMPGVEETFIAHCTSRIPASHPPRYNDLYAFDYYLEKDELFAHPEKVAVIIDGLAISAADYFARAVSLGTSVPLVGSPASGAYGGGAYEHEVSADPQLSVVADPSRCVDADGLALEGRSVEPTHPVEYDPLDLAAGKDTLLEAAVALVK